MEYIDKIVNWYIQNKNQIDLVKDVIFVLGSLVTLAGVYQLMKLLFQRKMLNKRQEMDNDARLYNETHKEIREYVKSYDLDPSNLRDVGIILLYMKNYPYKLDDDGFRQMLYYHFFTQIHQPSGYMSGKGLYVVDFLYMSSESIYYNERNQKWFIHRTGRKFRNYEELSCRHLVKRIPFANIYGYDFNSDWAEKNEPVFYTRYVYNDWRLFADDLEALTWQNGEYTSDRLSLQKHKQARRIRAFLYKSINGVSGYFSDTKTKRLFSKLKRAKKDKAKDS